MKNCLKVNTEVYTTIDMEKKDLKKLTKRQLINLLFKKVSNHEIKQTILYST